MDFNVERRAFNSSIFVAASFVVVIWCIKLLEMALDTDLSFLGVYPRSILGLVGVFCSPFIHGGFDHLTSNSIPLFVLLSGLFYFFRQDAWHVLLYVTLTGQFWVWIVGRDSYHIGASGVVYSLFGFLLMSGLVRKSRETLALSAIALFMYGGMLIGIAPNPLKPQMSWESHLMGLLSGLFFAFFFRKSPIYGVEKSIGFNEETTGKSSSDPSFTYPDKQTEFIYFLKNENNGTKNSTNEQIFGKH